MREEVEVEVTLLLLVQLVVRAVQEDKDKVVDQVQLLDQLELQIKVVEAVDLRERLDLLVVQES